MSIDAKVSMFNKTPANQVSKYNKKIIHHDPVGFIPEKQRWFSIQNQ